MMNTVAKLALAASLVGGMPYALQAEPQNAQSAQPAAAAPASQAQQKPNVLVWMIDDVGYAQLSSYGGLVATPNIDRVARMGLRYTNYHTAPICSAARASFLSGRNPHSVHIGGHATAARNLPGYDAHIPPADGTVADNLHSAGYTTFAVGKWDHLPNGDATPTGPFNQWPSGQGFDKFYGFLAADTDNFHPTLVKDHTPIQTPQTPSYHLSADMADQAIAMVNSRFGKNPAQPFFMYWATGAAHAPHHAPPEWIARYKGKFDMGWDKARDVILKQQIKEGIVPKGTKLAQRPETIRAWADLSAEEQKLYARQMEVFAASLSYADAQFGRILDALEADGELDNTIIVIVSDNGASAEGGLNGLHDEAAVTGGLPPGIEGNMKFYDDWGGPTTFPHYAVGWAVAGDTPLRYFKQVAHEGGTRVPLIVSWPKGVAARGEKRHQFVHVSDVAPTILAMTETPLAKTVNNVAQNPMEGKSFAATLADPKVTDKGRAQYVELYGNRGLWQDNWQIVTSHRTATWDWKTPKTFDEPWELYDLTNDLGQSNDLAAKYPDRVASMAKAFEEQAQRYNVYPMHNLSDSAAENFANGRQDFVRRKGLWKYPGPISNITQAIAPPVNMMGFKMTARLDLPAGTETGPIFAFGGQLSGIGFYLDKGKPTFILNGMAGETATVVAPQSLAVGAHNIELRLNKGAVAKDRTAQYQVTILSDGKQLVDQTVQFKLAQYFGIPETFGVGADQGSPVMKGYPAGAPFPGGISDVVFDFSGSVPSGIQLH